MKNRTISCCCCCCCCLFLFLLFASVSAALKPSRVRTGLPCTLTRRHPAQMPLEAACVPSRGSEGTVPSWFKLRPMAVLGSKEASRKLVARAVPGLGIAMEVEMAVGEEGEGPS